MLQATSARANKLCFYAAVARSNSYQSTQIVLDALQVLENETMDFSSTAQKDIAVDLAQALAYLHAQVGYSNFSH